MVGRERWRLSDHKEGAHGREAELLSGGTRQEEHARAQTHGETVDRGGLSVPCGSCVLKCADEH